MGSFVARKCPHPPLSKACDPRLPQLSSLCSWNDREHSLFVCLCLKAQGVASSCPRLVAPPTIFVVATARRYLPQGPNF